MTLADVIKSVVPTTPVAHDDMTDASESHFYRIDSYAPGETDAESRESMIRYLAYNMDIPADVDIKAAMFRCMQDGSRSITLVVKSAGQ